MEISVAHSPDADDFLLFWAIRMQRIDCEGLAFSFRALDTEDLNRAAVRGEFGITAISSAAYLSLREQYLILPHGASVSRGYGPALVSPTPCELQSLQKKRIGIPGQMTTAGSLVRSLLPDARFVELPLQPFERVYEALAAGEVDAAVLIHEGQLSYSTRGLQLVLNIGAWWQRETGLPLPLGVNVIRRTLGDELIARTSRVLRRAIQYGVTHVDEISVELATMNAARGADVNTPASVKHYLSLYANKDSLELDEECRKALYRLLDFITTARLNTARLHTARQHPAQPPTFDSSIFAP